PLAFIEKKDVKKMDLFIQYALAAAQFAMDDSRLEITTVNAPNIGVYIGSGIGGFITIEREHEALLNGGPRKVSPFFIPSAIINLASGQVSIRFGAKGPNSATCTACSASAHADGDAARRAMAMANRKAGIVPSDVNYINAHGTSTPYSDKLETLAIHNCFGDHAEKLAISSTKSMTGHLLGGAGGLEAGVTSLAVRDQVLPPTINLESQDPGTGDMDFVPNQSRKATLEYAMSNSFGFGGTNGALLFK